MNTFNVLPPEQTKSFPKTAGQRTARVAWPRAVLFVNDNSFAGVCAWCAGKGEADAWCHDQGFVVTHTICPKCRSRMQQEHELTCRRHVA